MKCSTEEINKLVANIRKGKPPKVATGKFDENYFDVAPMRGFGIRVLRSGAANWFVNYPHLGRIKKATLPDVRILDRKDAIQAALDVVAKARLENLDPARAKREAALAASQTLKSAVEPFLAYKRNKGLKRATLKSYETILTEDYFAKLHNRPLSEIDGAEINDQLDNIKAKHGNSAAFAACSVIKGVFKWGLRKGWLKHSPMDTVENPEASDSRKRVLTNAEIRLIWKTTEEWLDNVLEEAAVRDELRKSGRRLTRDMRGSTVINPLRSGYASNPDLPRSIQLLFLTGCRKQEIGNLRHDQVDLKNREICIPKHLTKNSRHKDAGDLHLPLSDMAVEILSKVKERPGHPYVFGKVGVKTGLGLYISHANKKIDERIGMGGKLFRLDPVKEQRVRDLIAEGKKIAEIRRKVSVDWYTVKLILKRVSEGVPVPDPKREVAIPDWTIHDIRRTVRTRLTEECGVDKDIAEHLVGHIVGKKIVRTYDRSEFWEKKCEAMDKWAKLLRSIIDGTAKEIPRSKFGRKLAA
jgi:integrase